MKKQTFTCPSCAAAIHYGINLRAAKPVELSAYLEELRQTGHEPIDRSGEDFYRANVLVCPCCDKGVQLKFRLELLGAEVTDIPDPKSLRVGPAMTRRTITPEMMMELGRLRREGVVEAFKQASLKQSPESGQRVFDRSLLRWLQEAAPREIDGSFYADYGREFKVPPSAIEFYFNDHIAGVVVNGSLRWFVPARYLSKKPNGNGQSVIRAIPTMNNEHQIWKRTKFGYIVGSGEFFKEMRKKSAGDFAKATGNF